jgi:uncharacterized protein (TIGR03382 family)
MSQGPLSALLNLPLIARVRRNHALEHATMQVLSERDNTLALMGRSSLWGFYIYGNVDTEDVVDAAREGLRRLKTGRREMAIHPNCGSNYVVAGAVAGMGAFIALGGLSRRRREGFLDRLARLPLAWAVGTLGVILSRPLGAALQAHVTTKADVGDLRIDGIVKNERAGTVVHLVRTEG